MSNGADTAICWIGGQIRKTQYKCVNIFQNQNF